MERGSDLRALERKAFRAAFDDGLWDVILSAVLSMFAVAPSLSALLGDFWSSAVFLPVWIGIYLLVRLVRRRVLVPRLGVVRLAPYRRMRLRTYAIIMMVINVIALVLGVVVAFRTPASGWVWAIGFGLALLVLCSLGAYFLDLHRLFFYGLLLCGAPIVGEWLWREGLVAHHGFPVMFGAVAAVIALAGLLRFFRLLHRHSRVPDQPLLDVRQK